MTAISGDTGETGRRLAGDPRPLLGFFTRLPVGGAAGMEDLVAAFPLVPLVGWVTGGIGALALVVFVPYVPPAPAAGLLLALLVGLTGLNQTDGLADLGDGLMVHGDAERRREVMHDHSLGTGALGITLFTYLVAFGVLVEVVALGDVEGISWAAAAVVVAEVLARTPYLVLAGLGSPSHEGLGSAFVEGFGIRHMAIGGLAALPVLALGPLVGWTALGGALVGALVVPALVLPTASRLLGGVGGDVMGASQELGRTAALVGLVVGFGL